jgi:hypothetical protein
MKAGHHSRALALRDNAAEVRTLRHDAEQRYNELQLLAAALQDNIDDLRRERDRLLSQVALLRDDSRRENAAWLHRGLKSNRG